MSKKGLKEWWSERIQELTMAEMPNGKLLDAANLPVINPSLIYQGDLWTLKKLVIYKYYIDIYTKIISKHFRSWYYFDFFSGSGLVEIKREDNRGTPLRVFGSALLGVLYPKKCFTEYVFIDTNKVKCVMLEKILEHIKTNYSLELTYTVIHSDMNNIERYKDKLDNIKMEGNHALVIIDPEGVEPKWDTVKEILSYKCDTIITFMNRGIARTLGKAKSDPKSKSSLEEFCGFPLEDISNVGELEENYIKHIKEECKKEVYRTIEVNTNKFGYDIIVITKKTRGENPWLKSLDILKKNLEIDDRILCSIIDQLQGKADSLDYYQ